MRACMQFLDLILHMGGAKYFLDVIASCTTSCEASVRKCAFGQPRILFIHVFEKVSC